MGTSAFAGCYNECKRCIPEDEIIFNISIDNTNEFLDENTNIFKEKRIEKQLNKDNTLISLIYLVDLTYSMEKYRDFISNIENINKALKEKYNNIIFGSILYRDFDDIKSKTLKLNLNHIKVTKPSSLDDNMIIPIEFIGGGDYAEDWANSYYEISQLNIDYNYEKIVIHFCDSGAHGKRFSDYDENNEQEKL